jgi:ParB-like chromosome segregation protein Spo0J
MSTQVSLDKIPAGQLLRPLDERHVARLMASIEKLGFLDNFPIGLSHDGDLYDGSHRAEAARRLKFETVPVTVATANGKSSVRLALESNAANETSKPTTFIDLAETIWRLIGTGQTQQQVADDLGWTKQRLNQFASLQSIDAKAWQIVSTTVRDFGGQPSEEAVDRSSTTVDFSERLLRVLVPLTAEARAPSLSLTYAAMSESEREAAWAAAHQPEVEGEATHISVLRSIIVQAMTQQCELCRMLARGKDNKGHKFGKADFTLRAWKYRARNALERIGWEMICSAIPEGDERNGYIDDFDKQIEKPIFVEEYFSAVKDKKATDETQQARNEFWRTLVEGDGKLRPGPKLEILVKAYIAAYEDLMKARVIVGDFREVGDQIDDGSIDAIVTDPPYAKEFIGLFEPLAALAIRVLKPGGSCLVLCGQSYLPEYLDALRKHLDYHWAIGVHMPGGQAVQQHERGINIFWKPALWFTKGPMKSAGVSDFIRTDVNNNDKRFHPWGQSEQLIRGLIERCSMPGHVILDPMMGAGTTGVVCRCLNRDFVGIEIDEDKAKQAQERIAETSK